jgi:hypothetical protein
MRHEIHRRAVLAGAAATVAAAMVPSASVVAAPVECLMVFSDDGSLPDYRLLKDLHFDIDGLAWGFSRPNTEADYSKEMLPCPLILIAELSSPVSPLWPSQA